MKKFLLFVFLLAVAYLSVHQIAFLIGGLPNNGVEHVTYQDEEEGSDKSLPLSHPVMPDLNHRSHYGTFTLHVPDNLDRPALYVPYYQGNLKIWIGEQEVKAGVANYMESASVATLNDFIWLLDPQSTGTGAALTFSLAPPDEVKNSTFLTLSKFYVGEYDEIVAVSNRKKIFHQIYRPAIILSLLLSFVTLTGLTITGALGREAAPLILVIAFMIFNFTGALNFIWDGFSIIHQYSYAFGAFGASAMNLYVSVVKHGKFSRMDLLIAGGAVVIAAIALFLMTPAITGKNATYINVLINVPLLLIGMTGVAVRSLYTKNPENEGKLLVLAVAISVWILSICNGLLGRFGLIDISVTLPVISILFLFFIIGYIFSEDIVATRNKLRTKNVEISAALAAQSRRLEVEFNQSAILRERDLLARSYERISNDLHDGVLTYLFTINTLADKQGVIDARKIQNLSQFCLNEIRIILSSGVTGSAPLIMTLANLRHNIFDTLQELGIETHWNVKGLVDLPPTDLRFNLDIVRVIQEAIHNAVERSKCTSLSVFAETKANNVISFCIINEGGTPLTKSNGTGFGLRSMELRVNRLGGQFSISPSRTGAKLEFDVPLPTSEPEPLER